MEIFLDTASIGDIADYADFIDGVTTNPSLIAKENRDIRDIVRDITEYVSGPISVEVLSNTYEDIISEAHIYKKISDQVVIKIPITKDGLRACKDLSSDGISVNMTLCFSAVQGIMAAKCDATYVSPFIGRLDDIGANGVELITTLRNIFYNYFDTKILAASIRSVEHVVEVAEIGVDAVTIPPKIMKQMYEHPCTAIGIEKFMQDVNNAK